MFKTFTRAFAAWFCLSFSALAQETFTLQEVQVTANRYEQKQTGKTLTVLSDSLLRASEGQTLSQILQAQTGLQVVGSGQPYGSVQSIALRGAGFGQTLILVDGIPVYEPSGIGATFDINLIPVQNIERVEILKDGQSTVYGSDAIAGVIHIITRKSTDQKARVNAGLTGGSFGTLRADAALSGTLNTTQYTLGISSARSRGFSAAAGQGFERDGYKDLGLNAKVIQKITDQLSANALVRYQKYDTDLDEAALTDDRDYTYGSDNLMYGGGLLYTLPKGKITFNYLGSAINRTFTNDSADVATTAWSRFSLNEYTSRSDFFELFSTLSLGQNLHLLAGASHMAQNMDYKGYEVSEWGRTDYDAITSDLAHTGNSSIYANLSGSFPKGFGFEAGARSNFHSVYGNTFVFHLNPYFLIQRHVKVFASYGSSFRNPALYQLYSPYGNLDLTPELARTYEAGVQVFGKDPRDFVRVLGFGRQYNDMIIFESLPMAPWGIYTNLHEKTTQQGVELEAVKRWNKFTAGLNYTLLDGTVSDDLAGKGEEIRAFLRRPRHTLNLKAGYTFADRLTVGIQSQYLSKRNDTFYNPATYVTEAKILDGYSLVHLQAQYRVSPHVSLHFSGQNIFNADYQEMYGYNSRKATFLVGGRVNF